MQFSRQDLFCYFYSQLSYQDKMHAYKYSYILAHNLKLDNKALQNETHFQFSAAKAAQEAQMSIRSSVRSSGYFHFDSL